MNATTLMHPITHLALRAEASSHGPRTRLTGALVLGLVWAVLAGSFLLDVARGASQALQ